MKVKKFIYALLKIWLIILGSCHCPFHAANPISTSYGSPDALCHDNVVISIQVSRFSGGVAPLTLYVKRLRWHDIPELPGQSPQMTATQIDIKYQFVGGKKVKGIHVDQAVFDRLSKGQLAIIAHRNSYAVIPLQVAEKIRERDDGHFIVIAEQTDGQMDEDDPYAAYQIPDDLMW